MVRKLMADNFREIWRYWSGIGLPAIFVMIISLLFYASKLPFVSSIAFVAAILAMIVVVLALPLILVLSYYRSLYGAEGYLAHTLPVRGRDLYLSKVATAFVYLFIDLVLSFVLLAALNVAMDLNNRQAAFTGLRAIFDSFAALDHKFTYITVFIAYVFFTFFMMITQFAFVISKGSEARFHRIGLGGPVIVYLITYVAQQILSLVGMIALPLGIRFGMKPDGSTSDIDLVFRSSLQSFIGSLRGEVPTDFIMGLGFVLLLLALGVVYIALTIRSLEKHTSLR